MYTNSVDPHQYDASEKSTDQDPHVLHQYNESSKCD